MRGADFSTDHRMILSKMSLCMRSKTRKWGSPKKIDCGRLQGPELRETFQDTLKTNLTRSNSATDTENLRRERITNAVRSAGLAGLGTNRRKHRDWFDESDPTIRELLQAKHAAHAAVLRCPNSVNLRWRFAELRAETQRRLKAIKNDWWSSLAREIKSHADSNDIHKFYAILRTVGGPVVRQLTPVRSAAGNLLRGREGVLDRWKENFFRVLYENIQYDLASSKIFYAYQ